MLLQACLLSKLLWFVSTSLAWRWSGTCRVFKAGFELQQSMRSGHIYQGWQRHVMLLHCSLTATDAVCTAQLQGCAVESRKRVIPRKCFWFLLFVSAGSMPRKAAARAPPPDLKPWLQFNLLFSKQCWTASQFFLKCAIAYTPVSTIPHSVLVRQRQMKCLSTDRMVKAWKY